jgi:hypothetical protein
MQPLARMLFSISNVLLNYFLPSSTESLDYEMLKSILSKIVPYSTTRVLMS